MRGNKLYLIIALAVYSGVMLWFLLNSAVLNIDKDVNAKKVDVKIISEDKFTDPNLAKLKGYASYGQTPVTNDANQQGKDNPFAP